MTLSTFSFPTTIEFGVGACDLVGPHLVSRGLHRPLVVTDRGVAGLPIHDELLDHLSANGLDVGSFSGVFGDPVVSQVEAGVEAFLAHDADSIVGLGGGAALDAAKAIGLLATHPGHLFDYEDEMPGARPIDDRIPWFVAVPTTAGTGSEVGRSAVIADDETHVKKIVFSPHLLARVVFADPSVTVGLPPHLTAATGMDALTHNVEAYLARGYHPICDGIALEGVRLCARHLPTAVQHGDDLDARAGMLMASMMGAIAFQKGLGLVHSCAHALGTAVGIHHGLANALMIDHALPFNLEASPGRFSDLSLAAGLDGDPAAFIVWLRELKSRIGIPADLTEQGVAETALDDLTRLAAADACHANNPRPVTEQDFRSILAAALP